MEIDNLIREQIGCISNERIKLLLKVSKEKIYIDELTENEEELVRVCIQYQWIRVSGDGYLFLTDLGKTLVKGAKEVYNLE